MNHPPILQSQVGSTSYAPSVASSSYKLPKKKASPKSGAAQVKKIDPSAYNTYLNVKKQIQDMNKVTKQKASDKFGEQLQNAMQNPGAWYIHYSRTKAEGNKPAGGWKAKFVSVTTLFGDPTNPKSKGGALNSSNSNVMAIYRNFIIKLYNEQNNEIAPLLETTKTGKIRIKIPRKGTELYSKYYLPCVNGSQRNNYQPGQVVKKNGDNDLYYPAAQCMLQNGSFSIIPPEAGYNGPVSRGMMSKLKRINGGIASQ